MRTTIFYIGCFWMQVLNILFVSSFIEKTRAVDRMISGKSWTTNNKQFDYENGQSSWQTLYS
jgi:hypothetical protein